MNEKENKSIREVYKNLVNLLRQNHIINRYEYYMLGGVSLNNAPRVIYQLFRERQITLQEYEMLRNYIKKQLLAGGTPHNKEFILATYYQFGNVVITDEEKHHIWNSLCKIMNESDIDDVVFSGAVRAYALENGLIKNNSKKLIKAK